MNAQNKTIKFEPSVNNRNIVELFFNGHVYGYISSSRKEEEKYPTNVIEIVNKLNFNENILSEVFLRLNTKLIFGSSETEIFSDRIKETPSRYMQDPEKIAEIVENHLREYPKIVIEDMQGYVDIFDPRSTYLGWENRNVALILPAEILPTVKQDPELLYKCYQIFLALHAVERTCTQKQLDTLVSEVKEKLLPGAGAIGCPIPLDVEIINVIQGMSLRRLKAFKAKFRNSFDHRKDAALIEQMINPIKNDELQIYATLVNAINSDCIPGTDLGILEFIHDITEYIVNFPRLKEKVIDYIVESTEPWSVHKLDEFISLLKSTPWSSVNKGLVLDEKIIIDSFLEVMSLKEYLNLIRGIKKYEESNHSLENLNWIKISQQAEQCVNIPVEWWLPLFVSE